MSTKPGEAGASRRHEHEFEIAVSPEAVWKAITDARELTSWFPLAAEVEPGPGGQIVYDWGEGFRGACRIESWEPPRHLRTSWLAFDHPTGEDGSRIAVDWFIDGERGRSRLRLVHSGFGPGREWDEEFNGTRRGWAFELRSLKHYLERHAGKARFALWPRRDPKTGPAAAWVRLFAADGLIRTPLPAGIGAGDPVHLELSTGDRFDGRMLLHAPPQELVLTLDNWNDGLCRLGVESCAGATFAHVWVSLWDVPEQRALDLDRRLEEALTRLFP